MFNGGTHGIGAAQSANTWHAAFWRAKRATPHAHVWAQSPAAAPAAARNAWPTPGHVPGAVDARASVVDALRAAMPGIPAHRADGALPAGIHAASWAEFSLRFGTNGHRLRMLEDARRGLLELRQRGLADEVVVGGSFVRTKAEPGDIDFAFLARSWTDLQAARDAVDGLRLRTKMIPFDAQEQLTQVQNLQGGRYGETFLSFFSHDRSGNPLGTVLLDLRTIT